jgi:cytochrome c-type biogenesis protein
MGESFANAASSGPLLLAIGAAAIAGLVSFLSRACCRWFRATCRT